MRVGEQVRLPVELQALLATAPRHLALVPGQLGGEDLNPLVRFLQLAVQGLAGPHQCPDGLQGLLKLLLGRCQILLFHATKVRQISGLLNTLPKFFCVKPNNGMPVD